MKMNSKRLIGVVCAMALVLSTVAFAGAPADSTETLNTEFLGTAQQIAEPEIIAEEIAANDEGDAELYAAGEPKQMIYLSYTYGASKIQDVSEGGITIDGPEGTLIYDEENSRWVNSVNSENGFNYTTYEGRNCIFATRFLRPTRNYYVDGNIFYGTKNSPVATNSVTNYVVDVEYFGNTEQPLTIWYHNSETSTTSTSVARVNSGQWETARFTLTDMYLKPTGTTMASGRAQFKLTTEVDTYISKITVCEYAGYSELTSAKDALSIGIEEGEQVTGGLTVLPTLDGGEIQWSSDTSFVVFDQQAGTMRIKQDASPQAAKVTAKLIKDGFYLTKEFNFVIAGRIVTAPIYSEPVMDEEAGIVSVTLAEGSGDIILVAYSQNTETGMISDLAIRNASSGQTVTADVVVGDGEKLGYYIIKEDGSSAKNFKPTKPENFEISTVAAGGGVEKFVLRWVASEDDYGQIAHYNIYNNGTTLVGTKDAAERETLKDYDYEYVVDTPISSNVSYAFTVEAVDTSGNKSELTGDNIKIAKAYIDLATTKDAIEDKPGDGISFRIDNSAASDRYTIFEENYHGVACRRSTSKSENGKWDGFLYFALDANVISDTDRNLTIKVTYFDEAGTDIKLTYAADNNGASVLKDKFLARTGTNQWKTVEFELNDAKFTKPSNLSNSDFRFGEHPIYISEVTVVKTTSEE